MNEPITAEQLLEHLELAVAEKGEGYVYDVSQWSFVCRYAELDPFDNVMAPSCIIGHVLEYQFGRSLLEDLVAEDLNEGVGIVGLTMGDTDLFANKFTMLLAGWAQDRQDAGAPWGKVRDGVRAALAVLDEYPIDTLRIRHYGKELDYAVWVIDNSDPHAPVQLLKMPTIAETQKAGEQ